MRQIIRQVVCSRPDCVVDVAVPNGEGKMASIWDGIPLVLNTGDVLEIAVIRAARPPVNRPGSDVQKAAEKGFNS